MIGLVPHAGAMVLLDELIRWDAAGVACSSRSHLVAGNPLRRAGRIAAVCGMEWGLQAMAVHGALLAGGVRQRAGYVARLRGVEVSVPWLDEEGFGALGVEAVLERSEAGGMVYGVRVSASDGRWLVRGGAVVALPG